MWVWIHRVLWAAAGRGEAGVAFLDGLKGGCANGDAWVGRVGVSGVWRGRSGDLP